MRSKETGETTCPGPHVRHAHYICAAAHAADTDIPGLARTTGVSPHTLALLFAGVTENPTMDVARKLAAVDPTGEVGRLLMSTAHPTATREGADE